MTALIAIVLSGLVSFLVIKKLSSMSCKKCGEHISSDFNYCTCGKN